VYRRIEETLNTNVIKQWRVRFDFLCQNEWIRDVYTAPVFERSIAIDRASWAKKEGHRDIRLEVRTSPVELWAADEIEKGEI